MSETEEDDGFDAHMAYLEIERGKLKIVDIACCYNCALAEHGYEGEITCKRTNDGAWGGMGVGPINACEHHSAIEARAET